MFDPLRACDFVVPKDEQVKVVLSYCDTPVIDMWSVALNFTRLAHIRIHNNSTLQTDLDIINDRLRANIYKLTCIYMIIQCEGNKLVELRCPSLKYKSRLRINKCLTR